jgi:hypothetical protein
VKTTYRRAYLGLGWALATMTLAACQRNTTPDVPVPTAAAKPSSAAEARIAGSIVNDPSLPPATQAVGAAASGAASSPASESSSGQDTKANAPGGTLTKEEESNQMPKAGQANNHSSPSFEGGSKK